jgi:hypothetical protein
MNTLINSIVSNLKFIILAPAAVRSQSFRGVRDIQINLEHKSDSL